MTGTTGMYQRAGFLRAHEQDAVRMRDADARPGRHSRVRLQQDEPAAMLQRACHLHARLPVHICESPLTTNQHIFFLVACHLLEPVVHQATQSLFPSVRNVDITNL
jgi:hypothetical protein